MTRYFIRITALLFLSVLWIACDTDPGLEPTQSGISGTIRFTGDWPENTDEVTVVAALKFPPTSLEDIVLSEPLPIGVDSTDFAIYYPPLNFEAVGVVWKEKDQPWDVTNIIGIYFSPENGPGLNPDSVSIPNKFTMVESIDVDADLSKAKPAVDCKIQGTLYREGEWPANTTTMIMVAANEFSSNLTLTDVLIGNPMPIGFDSLEYSFNAQPGSYQIFGALVLEQDQPISLNSVLRGLYLPAITNPIIVETDTSIVNDIDITILF